METSNDKSMREINAAIRDLRAARMIIMRNRLENDEHKLGETVHFVEEAINQLTMLKLKE